MKQVHVEIVTPVHNRRELTLQFLKSLSRIDKTGLKVNVIVVDDGSTDGTGEAIAREFPETEVLRGDGSWWFVGSANRAIKLASTRNADYVLLIVNDTIVDERFLRFMVECSEANPRSAIGSLLLLWDAPHRVFQVAPKFDVWNGGWRHLYNQTVWTMPKEAFEVDMIAGNCILFPAEVFREIGLMDEKRFPQYADAEFTPRIKKRGWRLLIEPRARVFNMPNEPASVKKMSLGKFYQALWGDLTRQTNIRTRFMMNWIAAPTKFHAVAASLIYVTRYFSKLFGFNEKWGTGEWTRERPLAEEYVAKRGVR